MFLDVKKVFDNHLENSLKSREIPTALVNAIVKLQTANITQIETVCRRTKCIKIYRVMQGSTLSPTLYNLVTDFIFDELNETTISSRHGFLITEDLFPLTVKGFADDILVIANSNNSASILSKTVIRKL